MEITVKIEITDQMIEDLIVTALEGGSNYWYFLPKSSIKIIKDATPEMEGEPLAIRMTKAILNDDNVFIPIFDYEHENDELGKITQKSIKDALDKMANSNTYRVIFDDIVNDNMDADTADTFFQLAVMNEVIFA